LTLSANLLLTSFENSITLEEETIGYLTETTLGLFKKAQPAAYQTFCKDVVDLNSKNEDLIDALHPYLLEALAQSPYQTAINLKNSQECADAIRAMFLKTVAEMRAWIEVTADEDHRNEWISYLDVLLREYQVREDLLSLFPTSELDPCLAKNLFNKQRSEKIIRSIFKAHPPPLLVSSCKNS
jgi:hypothetical protein